MAIDPRRLRQVRDQVIRYIYDNGADRHFVVPTEEVPPAIGASFEEVEAAIRLMVSQGMFGNQFSRLGAYSLSATGQAEAERLDPAVIFREPEAPHSVEIHANYSVVQVSGHGSNQSASLHIDQSSVLSLLDEIERELSGMNLDAASNEQAQGLLASLRQGISSKMAPAGLRAMGAALGSLLTSAGSTLGERLGESLSITLG